MDQGKRRSYDSVASVWKTINAKGSKNNVFSLESRTSGRESCKRSGRGAAHNVHTE